MEYKTLKMKLEREESNIIRIDPKRLIEVDKSFVHATSLTDNVVLEPLISGPLSNHAIFLEQKWDWIVGKDTGGRICLLPLRKEEYLELGDEKPK
jgi:hypothetical protein